MSVDFDPVRLGPNRRRFDPAIVAVLAVVVAFGFAVLKPWESGPVRQAAVVSPTLAPTARPVATLAAADSDVSGVSIGRASCRERVLRLV